MGRKGVLSAVKAIPALFLLVLVVLLTTAPARSGDERSQLAMFDVETGAWHIRYEDGVVDSFYYGIGGDLPLVGDWDCDGYDTVAMFRPSNGFIYLRNSNTFGVADREFFYGIGGDIPLAGDWDGDGCDTFAIYRQSEGKVYVSNRLGTHPADFSFYYGIPGDRPFSGDFNGDRISTVGLYRDTTGYAYIRDSLSSGIADYDFFYGVPSDRILTGDWDGDGADSVAIFRPSDETFYLSYENRQGFADEEVPFGDGDWIPLAGVFEPSPAIAARALVVDGTGIPRAAAYAGPGPHPLVMLEPDGDVHPWNDDLPASWRSTQVETLQLVAEVASDDSLYKIETCTYTPFGTINRWGYERRAILFEARSAERLASDDVSGSRPGSCPFSHSFDLGNLTENWYGQHVSTADVREWLAGHVESDLGATTTSTTSTTSPTTTTTSTTTTSTTSTTTTTTTTTTTMPPGAPSNACVIGAPKAGVNVTNARAFVDTDVVAIDGENRRLTVVGEVRNASGDAVGDIHLKIRYLDSSGLEIGYRRLELETVLQHSMRITFRQELPTLFYFSDEINTFPEGWQTCHIDVTTVASVQGPEPIWHVENVTDSRSSTGTLYIRGTLVNDGPDPVKRLWVGLYDDNGYVINVEDEYFFDDVLPGAGAEFEIFFDPGEPDEHTGLEFWVERP